MSEYTPGPWQQHDPQYCADEIWGDLEGPLEDGKVRGTHVCTVEQNERLIANARLIGAAPDLLNACQRMMQLVVREIEDDDADLFEWKTAREICRAAITKATR